jgi:hypothetical protein
MRIHLLALTLLLLSLTVKGQQSRITTQSLALVDKNKQIFYLGVENPFTLSVTDLEPDSLILTASAGSLTGSSGNYSITFDDNNIKTCILRVASRDTVGDTIVVDSVPFAVKLIPAPEILIASKSGGLITKDKLLAGDSLIVILRGCYLNTRWKVVSFTVSFYRDGFLFEFKSKDNKLTDEQKSAVSRLGVSTIVRFEDILVQDPSGVIRRQPTLKFELE